MHATLQIDDWTFRDVAVRYKGNGSFLRATRAGSDKISLKVDLNKYVKGQKLAGLTTINFQNNITDVGWMNEVLAYRLYRDAGALAPRTTYAQVYLTVDGQRETRYLGLYSISENVDENFFEERFGTRKGAILKPSTQDLFTDWGPDWSVYNQSYDPKTDLTDAQKAASHRARPARVERDRRGVRGAIGDYVDLDDFARYFAVLVWLANHDSLLQNGQNFYTYLHPGHEPDALHRLGPGLLVRERRATTAAPGRSIPPWSGQQPVPGAPVRRRGVPLEVPRAPGGVLRASLRARPIRAAGQRDSGRPSARRSRSKAQEWLPEFRSDRRRPFRHRAVRHEPRRVREGGARKRDKPSKTQVRDRVPWISPSLTPIMHRWSDTVIAVDTNSACLSMLASNVRSRCASTRACSANGVVHGQTRRRGPVLRTGEPLARRRTERRHWRVSPAIKAPPCR